MGTFSGSFKVGPLLSSGSRGGLRIRARLKPRAG
jgi:hypothetical protein